MKRSFEPFEYSLPGEEFTQPPEQPETLQDKRRYPAAFGPAADAPSAEAPEPLSAVEDAAGPTLSEAEKDAARQREAESEQTAARQTKRRRSLLLQMAAVASSIVLVTNSFGLDFLGLDGLFNDSLLVGRIEQETEQPGPTDKLPGYPVGGEKAAPSEEDPERPLEEAQLMAGRFGTYLNDPDLRFTVDGFLYAGPFWAERLHLGASDFFSGESIFYDAASNTLTLNGYHGSGLEIVRMGTDFTIRLEGENTLSQSIRASATILHITGSGSLSVNTEQTLEYGLYLTSYEGHDARIVIGKDVNMDVYGSIDAVRIAATGAARMLYYLSDEVLEGVRQIPNAAIDAEGRTAWDLIAPDTLQPLRHVRFGRGGSWQEPVPVTPTEPDVPTGPDTPTAPDIPPETTEEPAAETGLPIGGDGAFPILPDPLPDAGSVTVYFDRTQTGWSSHVIIPAGQDYNDPEGYGLFYFRDSNMLFLQNFQGSSLVADNMGSSFRIYLSGKNELTNRILTEGSSLTLTGEGYLAVNTSGRDTFGIQLENSFGTACLMIDSDVTLDVYGSGWAIGVRNTAAEKGIYYRSAYPLFGVRQEVSQDPGTINGEYVAWHTVNEEGIPVRSLHFGGEVPPDPELPGLPVGGDSEFPALPNLRPNTAVPGYGVLNEDYIQLFDRTTDSWEYLYLNPAWTNDRVSPAGISYDPATNTLTLNNYHGNGISANLLGNGFTVELIGENELTQDFMVWGFYTGGSITFTGTGSLVINSSREQEVGLSLFAEYSESCIMIDSTVTLDIYGAANAVNVLESSAEKAIVYLSEAPLRNVRQYVGHEETEDGIVYRQWILTGRQADSGITHLHIEGKNP